jgi:hypothetical protein
MGLFQKTAFAFSIALMLLWANLPAHASKEAICSKLLENVPAAQLNGHVSVTSYEK